MTKKKGSVGDLFAKTTTPAPLSAEKTPEADKPEAPEKKRMTVYLSPDELQRLDTACLEARSMAQASNYATKRTALVSYALDFLLSDFDEHGQDSALLRYVRSFDDM